MNYNKKNLKIQTNNGFNIYNTKENVYGLQKKEIPSQNIHNINEIPSYFNSDIYFKKYFLNQQLDNPQMNNLNINYSESGVNNNLNYNNIYNQQFQINNSINNTNNKNNDTNKIQFTNKNFTRRINNELLYKNNYEENPSYRKFPFDYYSNFNQKNNKLIFNSINLDNNKNNINSNNNNNDNLNKNIFNNNYQSILNNELKEFTPNEKKISEFNLRYKYNPKPRNYLYLSEYTHEYVGYDPENYIPNDDYYGVKSKIPYFNNIFRDGNYKSNYDKYFPKKKEKHLKNADTNFNDDNNFINHKNSILRNPTIKDYENNNSPILNKKTMGSNAGEEIIFGIIEGTGEDATKSKQIMDTYIDGNDEINVRKK
jgi:hypothetical protein